MEFEWSPGKRDRTLAERGVDFSAVLVGFLDPNRKIARDLRRDHGEEQYARKLWRATLSCDVHDARSRHTDHFGAQGQSKGAKAL
jgi:hypothetical protein